MNMHEDTAHTSLSPALSGPAQRGSDLPGPPISCALECAPGRQADGIPLTLRFERRPATLAARRKARVSAAPSAATPAWKGITVDVNAAKIPVAHTNVAAAAVAASALECIQVSIPASHRRKAAPCLRILPIAQSQERTLLAVTLAFCRAHLLPKRRHRAPQKNSNRQDPRKCHPQECR